MNWLRLLFGKKVVGSASSLDTHPMYPASPQVPEGRQVSGVLPRRKEDDEKKEEKSIY